MVVYYKPFKGIIFHKPIRIRLLSNWSVFPEMSQNPRFWFSCLLAFHGYEAFRPPWSYPPIVPVCFWSGSCWRDTNVCFQNDYLTAKMTTIDLSLVAYWLGTSQQQWKTAIIWYSLSTSLPLSLYYRFTLDPFIHLSSIFFGNCAYLPHYPFLFWPSCNYIALSLADYVDVDGTL